MKVVAVFAVVVCAAFFLSGSAAVPVAEAFAEEQLLQLEPFELEEPQAHGRQKRATCDLLSGTGISHSACAAHCILQHRRGGYCNSQAVCVCRN